MAEQPVGGHIPAFTLADRLRKAREETGAEQGEFAEQIGVSRGTVINYEKGHVHPREIVLRAWALRTGVPVSWLRTGLVPSSTPSRDGDATPEQHSPVAQLAEHPTVNRRIRSPHRAA